MILQDVSEISKITLSALQSLLTFRVGELNALTDRREVDSFDQDHPKAPFDIIQKITFNCWNLAQFFCSSLNYCLV